MNTILILLTLVLSLTTGNYAAASIPGDDNSDNVVISVGPEKVTLGEFEAIFRKNNTENEFNQEYLDEYANLFIDFKRKELYAQENQMDTSAIFKKELAGYRTQLSKPYLTDQSAEDELIDEAYKRMQYELRASHILLNITENASPADTLKVYNEIKNLRSRIIKGENFATIAKSFSNDPSAKTNGGDLGYFSAFRMVYPFESAAYKTKIGDVSQPFRTQFGYHILKVVDKRPNRGEVKVAHIMIEERDDANQEEIKGNQEKLIQLLESLNNGSSFEEMAKFSDDKSSASKKGELPWFGTGQMVPEFENTAFNLKNIGDVSKPVKSMYGWHVIKLLDKRPIPSFEDSKAEIQRNLKRDIRSNRGVESLVAKIKEEYNFAEVRGISSITGNNHDFYITRLNLLNDDYNGKGASNLKPFCKIYYKNWDRDSYKTQGRIMFTLDRIKYTQDDFADYLAENKINADSANTCSMVRKRYDEWITKICLDYEDSQLENKYPEFKALMKEYHDGIMLFDLMDQKVWSKAIKDSAGLMNYYNLTKENYQWDERAESKVYTTKDEATANKVRALINNRYNSNVLTSEEISYLRFGKGEFFLSDDRILSLMNRYESNRLRISTRNFEKEESAAVDNHWYNGLTANDINLDGTVFFANVQNIKNGGLKTFDESRGEVITNYQNYLEAIWKLELEEKFPASVNKDVLYSIIKK